MSERELLAVRLYRRSLWIFPRRIRRVHGDEMAAMFHAQWLEARRRGGWSVARLLLRTLVDLSVNGGGARFSAVLGLEASETTTPHLRRAVGKPSGGTMERMTRDLKQALRGFVRRPGFAAVAVLTLGLGIGGNTAIFSVVSALLLRPLPYADPSTLVTLNHYYPSLNGLEASVSAHGFHDYRSGPGSFSDMAVETSQPLNLTGSGEPERITAAAASPTYFQTLGVAPALGRAYGPDVESGDAHVAVLSYGFWSRRFGEDRDVLGRTLVLDGDPYTIVGVMPRTFRDVFNRQVELWVPLVLTEEQYSQGYTNEYLSLVARIAPGSDIASARAEMAAFAERLKQDNPDEFMSDWSIHVTGLQDLATKDVRPALLVLLGAVVVVLLIACANVTNLLLTRASGQRRQVAVRLAMGANRSDVLRRLLAEGVVLGLAGAAVGLGMGYAGLAGLEAVASRSVPGLSDIGLDGTVLLFTLVVSIGTGILVALTPALSTLRTDVSGALREGARAGDDRSGLRLRRLFVVSQLALSLALLAGAGLLLRSMARLQALSPGFDPEGLITFYVALPGNAYPDANAQRAFYDQLVAAVREVPGVSAAGVESVLPFGGGWSTASFTVVGYQPGPNEPNPWGTSASPAPASRRRWASRCFRGGSSRTPMDRRRRSSPSWTRGWRAATGPTRTRWGRASPSGTRRSRSSASSATPHTRAWRPIRASRCTAPTASSPGRGCTCSRARPAIPRRSFPRCAPRSRSSIRTSRSPVSRRWSSSSRTRWESAGSPSFCSPCSRRSPWRWPPPASTA